MTVLELSHPLPPGALLGPEVQALHNALSHEGAAWLRARSEYVEQQEDDNTSWVTDWRSATTGHVARPTQPNRQNGRFDARARVPAMYFRSQMHCGYAVENIANTAERFSLAVIYKSADKEGRSLASVSVGDNTNILFAAEYSGQIIIKDRAGTFDLECPAPDTRTHHALVVISYEAGKLRCAVNGGEVLEASGNAPGMEQAAKLFIGCRNNRAGLMKTLGDARITDVLYWPDRTILPPKASNVATPELMMLRNYFRWNT